MVQKELSLMSRQGKYRSRTLKNVKDFWNKEAQEWGDNPRVTIRDHYFRLLEIETVTKLIKGRRRVLDIGCGTGFSSIFYAQVVKELIGADYAESMVERAQRFLREQKYFKKTMKIYAPDKVVPRLPKNIRFEQGNILNIAYPNASFDVVIADRVLVNLPTRDLQDKAIVEVARVLQEGGVWIFAEATEQGHKHIDKIRQMFGLPILEKYWHNLYLDESRIEVVLKKAGFYIRQVKRFETYQFLTKVVHPLIVWPNEPQFFAGFNNAARIIAKNYQDYQQVMTIGLRPFLQELFRPLIVKYDPDKLSKYDQAVEDILRINPDFTSCSHQVLYELQLAK